MYVKSSKSSLLKCVHKKEVRRVTQLLIVIVAPWIRRKEKQNKTNIGFQVAVIFAFAYEISTCQMLVLLHLFYAVKQAAVEILFVVSYRGSPP